MPTVLYDLFFVLQGDRICSQIICNSLVGYETVITIMMMDGIGIPILLQQVLQGPIAWDGLPLIMVTTEVIIGEHN